MEYSLFCVSHLNSKVAQGLKDGTLLVQRLSKRNSLVAVTRAHVCVSPALEK